MSTQESSSIPKWREDFPIEQEYDDCITRRDFVRFLGLISGGFLVGSGSVAVRSLFAEEGPFPEYEIQGAKDLRPGQWLVYRYPDDKTPAILVRRESGEFISFHQKCPHLLCPVTYHPSTEKHPETIRCHCHNGEFDIATGQGIKGPPRELRPLRQVVLREEDDRVLAVSLNEITFN